LGKKELEQTARLGRGQTTSYGGIILSLHWSVFFIRDGGKIISMRAWIWIQ
jgi:hypothetical protein